jgi:microcystin-dependent protein
MSNPSLRNSGIKAQGVVFPGMLFDYAGTTAPVGYLLCYGQAISRTAYKELFNAIGTTWGVGDGSTTFNVPDLRGRVAAGKDNMGGVSADRLTFVVNGDNLAAVGGADYHILTTGEMPAHSHPPTGGYSYAVSNNGGIQVTAGGAGSYPGTTLHGDNSSAGGGGAHPNVQPTAIVNKIIYTGV